MFFLYLRWTTEDDIANAVSNAGVSDLQEVKFAENKINGQVNISILPSNPQILSNTLIYVLSLSL